MIKIINITDNKDELTCRAKTEIDNAGMVFVQSDRAGFSKELRNSGKQVFSLDNVFDGASDFEELISKSVEYILSESEGNDCVFLSLGGIAENEIIAGLCRKTDAEILPTVDCGDSCIAFAKKFFDTGVVLRAPFFRMTDMNISGYESVLVTNIASVYELSDVKLRLTALCDRTDVVFTVDGISRLVDINELDRTDFEGKEACVFMPAVDYEKRDRYTLYDLIAIMKRLRGRDGCPWDREQTHLSIAENCTEEAGEVREAIESGDTDAMYDELGDLLLQVVFHAEIAEDAGEFDFGDITTAICSKLIRRHPHIFGDAQASTPEEVLKIWQEVKKTEKTVNS